MLGRGIGPCFFMRALRTLWACVLAGSATAAVLPAAALAQDASGIPPSPISAPGDQAATDPVYATATEEWPAALAPYAATYKASVRLVPAWVEVRLQPEADGSMAFRSEVRGRGWASLRKGRIVENSRLRVDGDTLRPVRYEMRNGFSKKDRNIVTRFAHDNAAVSSYRGDELPVQAEGPLVDLLSLRLMLSTDLAHDRLAQTYAVVDGKGRLKTIEVTDAGTETLETGAGEFEARRLEYVSGQDRRFVIWLAPKLDYQMVRFEQYEDDRLRGRLVLDEFQPG